MSETTTTTVAPAKPWSAAPSASSAPPPRPAWGKLLPFVGPLVLFVLWDLVVRAGWIKAILLPTPAATLTTLVSGLAGGPLLMDFAVTVLRTLEPFLIAAAIGVALRGLLGSDEKAYPSVE